MKYTAKKSVETFNIFIVKDTTFNDKRIVTVQFDCPTFLVAQLNKHKSLDINSMSSRAVSDISQREYIPIPSYGTKGMKGQINKDHIHHYYECEMQEAIASAKNHAKKLKDMGIHREVYNRLNENFYMKTQVVTGSFQAFKHYLALRTDAHAQGDHQFLACGIAHAIAISSPANLPIHLPYTNEEELEGLTEEEIFLLSSARCGTVSYKLKVSNVQDDIARGRKFLDNKHMSVFQHAHKYSDQKGRFGSNWIAYREIINDALIDFDFSKYVDGETEVGF